MTLAGDSESQGERTVIVVDDEPVVRGLMIRALERDGLRVFGAGDGRAAFELVVSLEPDAVVTDLVMPGVNGWELALMMRQHYPDIPMLFVSAVACQEAEGLLGECLAKPVLPGVLVERVMKLLDGRTVGR